MGIAPYKYFTYDGESSRSYDVYLTGDGVFNAPERAVEMVEIPGRNGNYALDNGKFNNISVTYKAGIVDYSESNFADKVSAVRNWLCSKVGYKRLSDDYNPNEYRMAVYKSGVNIDHVDLKTGEFEITFDCKPQRWLTSGETATTVANNGTLSNPTPFDAEPLLDVDGYGTIGFNGYEVEIENVPIGEVELSKETTSPYIHYSVTISGSQAFMSGDTITINGITNTYYYTKKNDVSLSNVSFAQEVNCVGYATNGYQTIQLVVGEMNFAYGTPSTETASIRIAVVYTKEGTEHSVVGDSTFTVAYNGLDEFDITSPYPHGVLYAYTQTYSRKNVCPPIIGDSTHSVIPVYIDCDIGECWTVQGGEIVSLNGVISLGSDLPKLSSGTNTFTYDNTVTELKVTPRWWKV